MMLRNRTTETLTAAALVAPFVLIYCWMFVYPTIRMAQLSFTDAPLIGAGHWVGLDNYVTIFTDPDVGLRIAASTDSSVVSIRLARDTSALRASETTTSTATSCASTGSSTSS